jgi:triosephosphate isomerase
MGGVFLERIPLIAGNWKMNNTRKETGDFLDKFVSRADGLKAEIIICPAFTSLWAVAEKIRGTKIKLGSQNMYWEDAGAFTGEISPIMLKEISCDYVILGHSERRQYFAETDENVNKKVKAAIKHSITPIVCVGESLLQREQGLTETWVLGQVTEAVKGLTVDEVEKVVFAYEPIWAIGTGRTASGGDAQEVICALRKKIAALFGENTAGKIRILYGGSVKPDNIKELMLQPDIDGALVGGASLKPDVFYGIAAFNLD